MLGGPRRGILIEQMEFQNMRCVGLVRLQQISVLGGLVAQAQAIAIVFTHPQSTTTHFHSSHLLKLVGSLLRVLCYS
jgi:hypothetical protein